MRWEPPSERMQVILALPIIVPAVLAVVPVFLVAAGPAWVVSKIDAWRRANWQQRPYRAWFAWRPVRFSGFWDDVPDQWLWLETVDAIYRHRSWEYRPRGFQSKFDGPELATALSTPDTGRK